MKNKKRRSNSVFAAILIFCFIFTLSGCDIIGKTTPEDYVKKLGKVSLDYWTTWNQSSYIKPIIDAYQILHPNVSIKIRNWQPDEYEDKLIYYFAKDEGPDIFSIHNTWTRKYQDFIEPMPANVEIPYLEESGPSWAKERKIVKQKTPLMSSYQLKQKFIDQVAADAVIQEKIYGLPYYIDTLVMFYNIDLLNSANIAEPAHNWQEFKEHVTKITKFSPQSNDIIVSGAALGTSKNIDNFFDIISLLMMQVGTSIMENNAITINQKPAGWTKSTLPAEDALEFYTSFADPTKEVFSWNDKKINSYKDFINGSLAYFFGYSYHLDKLKSEAKKLHYSYTQFPMLTNNPPVTYANYWLETVSKKSKNIDYAWDFLNFAAKETNAKQFLETSQKPTALRSLIEEQKNNPELEPFVSQLLTAKSWYQGARPEEAKKALAEMIEMARQGEIKIKEILDITAEKIRLSTKKSL